MKIAANGIQINIAQSGRGDTALVFLHYWGGSSREWSEVTSRLADEYRCVALDARGSGNSDAPTSGYSTVDLAADVAGVIESLGLARYVLVGHSMGGKTAQLLASQRPAGLRGVALIASSPPSPMVIDEAQRAQMKAAYADRDSIDWVLDNILIGSPTSPASREQAVEDALHLSQPATLGWLETGTREDFSQDVGRIDVPVVCVAGALDRVDSLEVVHSHIVPHFKQAALHVLPKKGHLLPIEAPEEVAQILRDFVAALR